MRSIGYGEGLLQRVLTRGDAPSPEIRVPRISTSPRKRGEVKGSRVSKRASGTDTPFHRYQFHSTPDQFQFIFDAKCRLNLYAFG
jgi:hypothetical protein